jgi:hypothetical protein
MRILTGAKVGLLAAAAVLGVGISGAADAVDGVSIAYGHASVANAARIGVEWNWNKHWFEGRNWHLGGYWELSAGYWQGRGADTNYDISDVGFTPVFRIERNSGRGVYLEAGVGAHLLSRTRINSERAFSTAFQFGDHIGVGYRFGPHGRYDIGYRFQHLSNADIKKPNPGINFQEIRFEYHFH